MLIRKMMRINDTYCTIAWVHQFISPDGNVLPCCRFKKKYSSSEYNVGLKSLEDIFLNNPVQQKLREITNENQWHEGCDSCRQEEESKKGTSIRKNYNNNHYLSDNITKPEIRWIELALSNECNLKCRMCSSLFSYRIAPDEVELFGKPVVPFLKKENKWKTDFPIENLFSIIPTLRHVKFTGGEPLLTPNHYKFLKEIIRQGYSRNIYLNYSTNMTVPPSEKIIELWKKFKFVEVALSLDGTGSVIEYIRNPSKWEIIEENTIRFLELTKRTDLDVRVGVRSTVMAYNIFNMVELEKWYKTLYDKYHRENYSEKAWFNPTILTRPSYLRISVLPDKYKDQAIKVLQDKGMTSKSKRIFNSFCTFMTSVDDTRYLPDFIDYTRKLDILRSENLYDSIPQLTGILEVS